MANRPVKLKLLPRSTLKFKSLTRLPSRIVGGVGITATFSNGIWTISADTTTSQLVTGPLLSTDNAIARFDGTDGTVLQNSVVTISDTGAFSQIAIGAAPVTYPLEITTATATAFISQTNSGVTWRLGPDTGISSLGWGLYSAAAAAYRMTIINDGTVSFPAYGSGAVKLTAGVLSTNGGVTDLAATTANRLFGTNGTGVSGLVTLPAAGIALSAGAVALANDLAALEGLSSTGIAVRTTTDTWTQRTITGTAAEITVTNGDGVSGNPTLSIPTAVTFTGKTVTGGTFASPTLSGTVAGSPAFSGTNFITYANIIQMSAYSLLGNTGGTTGNMNQFTIGSLTHKAVPTGSDLVLIQDQAASGALKYSSLSEAVSGVAAGVTFIAGNTGAFTLSNGITNSTNDIRLAAPYFSASLSSSQTVTSTVDTKVQFNTEAADSNSWYDNATNYRFTPLLAGKYRVHASIECTATAVTTATAAIFKNGSKYARGIFQTSGTNQTSIIDIVVSMNGSTDYLEAYVNITGTGTCQAVGGSAPIQSWFEAHFISP